MLIETKNTSVVSHAWRKDFVVRGAQGATEIQKTALYNLALFLGFTSYVGCESYSVYVLKCCSPGHWYVGMTSMPTVRFERHAKGRGATYTSIHGVVDVWDIFTVRTRAEAVDLERTVFYWLKDIYPGFCISMGSICTCSKEAHS